MVKNRKKKLKEFERKNSVTLIILSCVIMVLFALLLFGVKPLSFKYYQTESRNEEIQKSKEKDSNEVSTVGWLRIQGTGIDYPVLASPESDYDYPVEQEEYVWRLDKDKPGYDKKINIMGHNVFNLGIPAKKSNDFHRLEELMTFVYNDIAEKDLYIQYSTAGEDYLYKIFSAGFTVIDDVVMYPYVDNNKEQMQEQIDYLKSISIYDYDVDVNSDDDMISIFTCTKFYIEKEDLNFVITGRRVRDKEKIDKYRVSRNKNYERVETILEEVNDNEDDSV